MTELFVKDVASVTGGQLFGTNGYEKITGFCLDSRKMEPGMFFVAVKGPNFDGHDYISDAVRAGAVGIISSRPYRHDGCGFIVVDDTLNAFGMIAAHIRRCADIPVIAITGTNGKTTVKDILAGILSSRFSVLKSPESYNNLIGVGITLSMMGPLHEAAVLEVGSNHPGEIARLAGMILPKIVVITNVGDGHLQYFGDRDGVFREKISLLDGLDPGGTVFLNGDDPKLRTVQRADTFFYGESEKCDYRITGVSEKDGGYEFSINGDIFFLPFTGRHNVSNAAAAIAVAKHMGLDHGVIRDALQCAKLPKMRLEKVTAAGTLFINDAYNANPSSFECALNALKETAGNRRKVVIAGDMLELGEDSGTFHRKTGAMVASIGAALLIAAGDNACQMAEGAVSAGMDPANVFCVNDRDEAGRLAAGAVLPGDTVLIKGSRKMKMEEILKCFITSCIR